MSTGSITFTPTAATPNTIYYQCDIHADLGAAVTITNAPVTDAGVDSGTPTDAGSSGSGGSSGSSGSSGASGTSGSSGASGAGGTTDAGATPSAPESDDGGCAVSPSGSSATGLVGLLAVGAALFAAKRRRR